MLDYAKKQPRKFLETVEQQVGLKNYDPQKEKRFSGSISLPYTPRPKFRVCVIGNQSHIDEAKKHDIPFLTQDDLKLLNKEKKKVKKLAQSYDAFVASSSIIRLIPRLLGPGLNKAGKFPTVINPSDDVLAKVEEAKAMIKFQLKAKQTLSVGVAVGNVSMQKEALLENIQLAINFLISLLPKGWQQVRRVYIKTSMGPSRKIYGI